MDHKKELNRLLEIVKNNLLGQNMPHRKEDIAVQLGYSRSYFSTLLGKNGVVTEEHIKLLKLNYPFLSGNVTPKSNASIVINASDVPEILGDVYERLIRAESTNAVLKDTVMNLVSSSTGKQAALISAELDEAIDIVSKRRLDELRKKK